MPCQNPKLIGYIPAFIRRSPKSRQFLILSPTVLGELLSGFGLGRKSEKNQKELKEFLAEANVLFLTINAQTAEEYAGIYKNLRQKGTPIPTNDMWIAAMALQLELPIFSFDAHFDKIEGLKIVRSVRDFGE